MDKNNIIRIKISLIGLLTGFINGLFGAGSGLLCVPALKEIMKIEEKKAHATTICAVFFASLVSVMIYLKNGNFDLMQALPYVVGGFLGAPLGAYFLGKIKIRCLNLLFALFLIYSALRMMLGA